MRLKPRRPRSQPSVDRRGSWVLELRTLADQEVGRLPLTGDGRVNVNPRSDVVEVSAIALELGDQRHEQASVELVGSPLAARYGVGEGCVHSSEFGETSQTRGPPLVESCRGHRGQPGVRPGTRPPSSMSSWSTSTALEAPKIRRRSVAADEPAGSRILGKEDYGRSAVDRQTAATSRGILSCSTRSGSPSEG